MLKTNSKQARENIKKYFKTEFERDKFIRKLRFSNRLKVLERGGYYE